MKALPVTLLLLSIFSRPGAAREPRALLLWPNGAPGSEGKTADERVRLTDQGEHIVSSVHRPSITPYVPAAAQATGAAVIVIPGGGHRELWMDHEGYRVAHWLSDHGIAAFVTPNGGEAGFNFCGIHNEGHVNVGFTAAPATSYLLDCRMLSAGVITYKIYHGVGETLRRQAEVPLADNHVMVMVAATKEGGLTPVELWPTPVTEPTGFLGCDLSVVTGP